MCFIKLWLTLDIISLLIIVAFIFDGFVLDDKYLYKYSWIMTTAIYFFLSSVALYGSFWFGLMIYGLWSI